MGLRETGRRNCVYVFGGTLYDRAPRAYAHKNLYFY